MDEQEIYGPLYHVLETNDLKELQESLDVLAEEGWIVHTFNTMAVPGVYGIGTIRYVVLMEFYDVVEDDPDEPEEETEDHSTETKPDNVVAMAMTGRR